MDKILCVLGVSSVFLLYDAIFIAIGDRRS